MSNNLILHTSISLLVVIVISKGAQSAPKSCSINFPNSVPKTGEPIYLTQFKNGSFSAITPDASSINFNIGDTLTLYCPNTKESNKITCSSPRILPFENYFCSESAKSEIVQTEEECGKDGKWYNVGFPLPSKDFHIIYRTCFDKEKLSPIYSYHVINGKAVGYHVKQERGNFRSTKGIYGRVKINQLYITHISRFKRIFGQSQKFFRKPLHYLARGHLSPEVDFVFGTEQHATELYINTAPQFQSINQGNWLRVERHVRNLAKALQDNLSVVTGILGILRLSNKKATQDIYLSDDNVIPVPNIFWKAVFYPKTNSSIVFVGSNNPHSDKFEPMCKDICDKAGFGDKQHKNQNFSDYTVGNVICCQLSEFVKKSKVILPKDLKYENYKKMLQLPTA
ncbi:uncharacterized protein LOC129803523 [Phlebotomus papatasi]|uniref:uncharacterized protein LOC129803523 n=1 Tax=Phlebotomus papatasi TaxID=29031 RepID=UPI0024838A19|nr:uncharacterized protein LOC129803523 [Phlebotomus papatasi]